MTKYLYHGSYMAVPSPLVNIGRDNLDFGNGFYLTPIEVQAERWAKVVAGKKGVGNLPIVNVYSYDEDAVQMMGGTIKKFGSYDKEWLRFVVDCRSGKSERLTYDIVEGGVADDQVIDTVEDYVQKRITVRQALNQLRYKEPNNQLCIRTQTVLDRCLRFEGSRIVK